MGHAGVCDDIPDGKGDRHHMGGGHQTEVDGKAPEVLLNERLMNLRRDRHGIALADLPLLAALTHHVQKPLLTRGAVE